MLSQCYLTFKYAKELPQYQSLKVKKNLFRHRNSELINKVVTQW
jgi:hypothetical protein